MTTLRAVTRLAAGLLLAACGCAHAVVTYFNGSGLRRITLQIGSNDTTVNTVTFDVLNSDVAPSAVPITGVPGNGAPATSPSNGIPVVLSTNRRGSAPDVVTLVADSSAGMVCQSGVCASSPLTIPFTTVSWTSYETNGGSFSAGIPSGTFSGGASQTLYSVTIPSGAGDSLIVSNVFVFTYDNATLYPSGTYTGRVTYTASVP